MKRLVGAVVALGLSGGVAQAQSTEWMVLHIDDTATGIDLASRTRSGDTATIWMVGVYEFPNDAEEGADYRMSRLEFSCSRQTVAQIASAGYTLGGRYIWGQDSRSRSTSVVPGTVVSAIFEAACKRDYVPDPETYLAEDTGTFVEAARAVMTDPAFDE